MLCSTPVILFAPSTQETPEITAPALVCPDHLIDPFWAEREAAFSPQPKAELLRTPPFPPEFPGQCATDAAGQFAWLVPDLLLASLSQALCLLKPVAPLSCIPS